MKNISFTKREEELMDFLWSYGEPITSNEMMELCKERTWSDSYLHVMLRSLQKKGAIEQCGLVQYGTQYARQFRCAISKEEYFVRLAMGKGVDKDSFAKVAVAMAASKEDDNEELIRTLEKIIEDFEEKKEA